MKTAIIASLTLLSLTAPTLAATTEQYQYKGQNAYASFYQYDECSSSYVDVYAFDSISKTAPGSPTSQKEAYLYYSNYNYCTGAGTSGYGTLKNPTFTSSNNLQSATLSGTFAITDSTGNTKNADVSLNWTGAGDTFRGNYQSHFQGPGYFSKSRNVGSYRDAKVTGNVTVDGKNLITNLTSYGSLSSSNSGSLSITRK
ncbi:hypothetical protein H6G06_25210 [Anabaena sphaerica FACHB-251]|uniref:Uncharacterized protein n=1 Tax=Anabaena sphaerica FACHB-251 TaxID=2692883 RepID=A0A927A3X4_9NOST|nr:hypothetical protein [Anabaena sphaerica]MBD2296691.1 hypothetical protein [Anabaena sphaerica FACHB-251]